MITVGSTPSDITPGVDTPRIDYDFGMREIVRLQARLEELAPCVIRIGALFNLYQAGHVVVRTPNAQLMWDYLESSLPARTKVRWFILPAEPRAASLMIVPILLILRLVIELACAPRGYEDKDGFHREP